MSKPSKKPQQKEAKNSTEDGGDMFHRNVWIFSKNMAFQPKIPHSSRQFIISLLFNGFSGAV
jgi:hypothetical protein